MPACDHKFIDSKSCLKCGWTPPQYAGAIPPNTKQPDIDIADLRAKAEAATPGPWEWWTSNSWRRLSSSPSGRDGDVLCPDKHPYDGHPDIRAREQDMSFIAAANPAVVLALLDRLAAAEAELATAHVRISNQQFQNDNLRENVRALKAKEEGMSEVWKALAEEGIIT